MPAAQGAVLARSGQLRGSTALTEEVAMPEGNSRRRPSKVAKYGVGEFACAQAPIPEEAEINHSRSLPSLVVYSFRPLKAYPYLSLQFGGVVQILEENAGWYRGFSLHDKHSKGIFPTSHIQLKDCEVRNPGWALTHSHTRTHRHTHTHTHTSTHLCSTVCYICLCCHSMK